MAIEWSISGLGGALSSAASTSWSWLSNLSVTTYGVLAAGGIATYSYMASVDWGHVWTKTCDVAVTSYEYAKIGLDYTKLATEYVLDGVITGAEYLKSFVSDEETLGSGDSLIKGENMNLGMGTTVATDPFVSIKVEETNSLLSELVHNSQMTNVLLQQVMAQNAVLHDEFQEILAHYNEADNDNDLLVSDVVDIQLDYVG